MRLYPERRGKGRVGSPLFAVLLLVAVLAGPPAATAHKVKVWDSSTAKSIQEDGGQLLADYGSYQFYEVDRLRPELLQSDTVEVRDDCNRIQLNAASIDTSMAAAKAVRRPAATFAGRRLHLIQFVVPVQSASVLLPLILPAVCGSSGLIHRLSSPVPDKLHFV